jgi:hypothetical protein
MYGGAVCACTEEAAARAAAAASRMRAAVMPTRWPQRP